jgi:hypothetical protein
MKRRLFLFAVPALAFAGHPTRSAALPHLVVYRDPGCGCCEAWVEHMRAAGFTADIADDPERAARRVALGISDANASCHTAVFGDVAIEGHVPAADVIRLINEKPDGVIALTVPAMPVGSPGMGPEGSGPPYDTLLIRRDGSTAVFASHQRG